MENFESEPIFTRSEVAKILNCNKLTIANRERAKKYPESRRDLNNYRIYTISDVVELQSITTGRPDANPILAALWDKGYRETNLKSIKTLVESAIVQHSRKVST